MSLADFQARLTDPNFTCLSKNAKFCVWAFDVLGLENCGEHKADLRSTVSGDVFYAGKARITSKDTEFPDPAQSFKVKRVLEYNRVQFPRDVCARFWRDMNAAPAEISRYAMYIFSGKYQRLVKYGVEQFIEDSRGEGKTSICTRHVHTEREDNSTNDCKYNIRRGTPLDNLQDNQLDTHVNVAAAFTVGYGTKVAECTTVSEQKEFVTKTFHRAWGVLDAREKAGVK